MKKLFLGIIINIYSLFLSRVAFAAPWADPGGVISKISNIIMGVGVGIALLGFAGSLVISSVSFGDDELISKGRKGATVAIVCGILIAIAPVLYNWALSQ